MRVFGLFALSRLAFFNKSHKKSEIVFDFKVLNYHCILSRKYATIFITSRIARGAPLFRPLCMGFRAWFLHKEDFYRWDNGAIL